MLHFKTSGSEYLKRNIRLILSQVSNLECVSLIELLLGYFASKIFTLDWTRLGVAYTPQIARTYEATHRSSTKGCSAGTSHGAQLANIHYTSPWIEPFSKVTFLIAIWFHASNPGCGIIATSISWLSHHRIYIIELTSFFASLWMKFYVFYLIMNLTRVSYAEVSCN